MGDIHRETSAAGCQPHDGVSLPRKSRGRDENGRRGHGRPIAGPTQGALRSDGNNGRCGASEYRRDRSHGLMTFTAANADDLAATQQRGDDARNRDVLARGRHRLDQGVDPTRAPRTVSGRVGVINGISTVHGDRQVRPGPFCRLADRSAHPSPAYKANGDHSVCRQPGALGRFSGPNGATRPQCR